MCEIDNIQQLIDHLKQEKKTNDEVIYGIVNYLKYKGNEYIKHFFMRTDNIRHIPHDYFQIMEKVISFNNCNYHLFALWNRYYSNSDVEIFFTDESLNGYIVANTPSSLDDKNLI